ncbi:monoamine oxidase, partial [Tremellales sp. Uapishka_1]
MKMLQSTSVDVVVIGAGLSGLTAACRLVKEGKSVIVLEARDRVGGKTLSIETELGGRVDVGAAWINEHCMPEITALAKRANNPFFAQRTTGRSAVELDANTQLQYEDTGSVADAPLPFSPEDLADYTRVVDLMETLSQKVNLDGDLVLVMDQDNISLDAWLNSIHARQNTKLCIVPVLRGLLGVELSEVSLYYILHYAKTAGGWYSLLANDQSGAQFQRTRKGNQEMSIWMASTLPSGSVRLSTPVASVTQHSPNRVSVASRSGQIFACCKVICSIPTPLYTTIRWSPSLPTEKLHLVQRSFLGSYSKLILVYKTAWWQDAGWSGFSTSAAEPACLTYDTCDGVYGTDDPALQPRQYSLTCFITGAASVRWSKLDPAERVTEVKAQVGRIFNNPAAVDDTIETIEMQWSAEEYSMGAPCPVFACGAFAAYGSSHGTPHGDVYFAGTEMSTVWKGYMEGAVVAGKRAAKDVIAALGNRSGGEAV